MRTRVPMNLILVYLIWIVHNYRHKYGCLYIHMYIYAVYGIRVYGCHYMYGVFCTECIVRSVLYGVQCTQYMSTGVNTMTDSLECELMRMGSGDFVCVYSLYSVQCTKYMYSVQCKLYTV